MRVIISLVLALSLMAFLVSAVESIGQKQALTGVAESYTRHGVKEVGSANLVTAVVVTYRGLDTLGEVTVLFTAASAVILLLSLFPLTAPSTRASTIVELTAKILPAPILLLGAYIVAHGHLTPGGGFPGGAVIAAAALLVLLGSSGPILFSRWLTIAESLAGLSFALFGFWGLLKLGQFLNNSVLGLGETGRLISAGLIPLISVAIGVKVASELSGILVSYRGRGE